MNDSGNHIVVLGAQPEWLSGLRGPMIRDFLARGYRVTAIGAEENAEVRGIIESWGAAYVVVPMRRAGLNPITDFKTLVSLYRTLRSLRPKTILAYTVKPIVYGLPIAKLAGIPRRFAMITGRGYAFLEGAERSRRIARFLAVKLYRFSLRFADGVMFHNEDDRRMFEQTRMISPRAKTLRIWGSGIDLEQHAPQPMPDLSSDGGVCFLMIGRLIRDKGVREFAGAAALVKKKFPNARFRLVGPGDHSPNGITADEVAQWEREGAIELVGPLGDVRPEVAASHVVVLPSYAEGLPRSVLEGMAAGRGIITTDAPGCADTVDEGRSGLLVPVRDTQALADAMEHFLTDTAFLKSAGAISLEMARDKFNVTSVNRAIAEFLCLKDAPSQ